MGALKSAGMEAFKSEWCSRRVVGRKTLGSILLKTSGVRLTVVRLNVSTKVC